MDDMLHGCLDAHTPDDPGRGGVSETLEEVVTNVPDSTIKPGTE